jgi:hypothetical protein
VSEADPKREIDHAPSLALVWLKPLKFSKPRKLAAENSGRLQPVLVATWYRHGRLRAKADQGAADIKRDGADGEVGWHDGKRLAA